MVSYETLSFIHQRLTEIKGTDDTEVGKIVGFKWSGSADCQDQPGMLPATVLVKFHDPHMGRIHSIPVPGCDGEAVEIKPISAKFFAQQGVTLQQTQLPLLPCWAATIHKVQGLSLDAAVIDLGPSMLEDGMTYVALSRVCTLDGVALFDLVSHKIKASSVVITGCPMMVYGMPNDGLK